MDIPHTMGQVLFIASLGLVGLLIHRLTRIETSLACLLTGFGAGLLIPLWQFDTGIRASNIGDLVFYVILPILIFEAAWHIQPRVLKRWLFSVSALSTLGLLLSSFAIAALLYFAIGHSEGFPWAAALLCGVILSATDPVSVVASLKRQQAPEDLATLVEGESLFNDAGALVLFTVVLGLAMGTKTLGDLNSLMLFATVFLGGLVLGGLVGLVTAILVLLMRSSAAANMLLVFCAFASFYIAEHFFHVSGILAVVAAALVSRVLLKEHEKQFLGTVADTWDWLGLLFNACVFVLMGLVVGVDMFIEQWLAIVIAIPAVLLARVVSVYGCGWLSQFTRNPVPVGWQHILVWGGLCGAVAIVLVLSLPVELPYWWTVQSVVFGVVLFSLFVQGPTVRPLIRRFASTASSSSLSKPALGNNES